MAVDPATNPVPASSPITRIQARIAAARAKYARSCDDYDDGVADGLEAALAEIIDGTCAP